MLNNTFKRIQFAQDVDEARKVVEAVREYGGATMNVASGKILPAFESTGTYIGGHPNTAGEPIGTEYLGENEENPAEHLTIADVLSHRDRIRRETGNDPSVALGLWNPSKEEIADSLEKQNKDIRGVNIDASSPLYTPEDLDAAFKARPKEYGATDLSNLETTTNPYFVRPKKRWR